MQARLFCRLSVFQSRTVWPRGGFRAVLSGLQLDQLGPGLDLTCPAVFNIIPHSQCGSGPCQGRRRGRAVDVGIWFWDAGSHPHPCSSLCLLPVSHTDGNNFFWLLPADAGGPVACAAWGLLSSSPLPSVLAAEVRSSQLSLPHSISCPLLPFVGVGLAF